jgi:prepilin-type N-terminal cleavage/methylation domain-containing protein
MLNINKKLCKKGFSLIELMVAVVILVMAIFGIFHAYSTGFMGMADARGALTF